MDVNEFRYVLVGGGLAGASAIEGIRSVDSQGSILLVSDEDALPYNRPPLSKSLWKGTKTENDILVESKKFYPENGVEVRLSTKITGIDPREKTLVDDTGATYTYEKLLLATGGVPKHLPLQGADSSQIYYYRYLNDYRKIRSIVGKGTQVLVIGGGFIGSEMAAAMKTIGAEVTMVFPEQWLCGRVFPEDLGKAIGGNFKKRGIRILSGDIPERIESRGDRVEITTRQGSSVVADVVIAGLGIRPSTDLAKKAGLSLADGIRVNEYLQSSDKAIYAAGDNAYFPCETLGKPIRIEHWDNALSQGGHAGRVMAGAKEPFTYLPYFFSDLFEFGYEAVGEVSTELETVAEWDEKFVKGTIYYVSEGVVRGVMLCNLQGKLDWAREQIGTEIGILDRG